MEDDDYNLEDLSNEGVFEEYMNKLKRVLNRLWLKGFFEQMESGGAILEWDEPSDTETETESEE